MITFSVFELCQPQMTFDRPTYFDRVLVLCKGYYHTNYELQQRFNFWLSCLQGFQTLTTVDLTKCLTSTIFNRVLVLTMQELHVKYEVQSRCTFGFMLLTSRCDIHTPSHTCPWNYIQSFFLSV